MRSVTVTKGKETKKFRIPSAGDWDEVAAYVADRFAPGDVIALSGSLGAGKTTFVQHLAGQLGIRKFVPSPTFALLRSYPVPHRGRIGRLLHVDAYRIGHPREMLALDLEEELLDGKTAAVIEWPERIEPWLRAQKNLWRIIIEDIHARKPI